MDTVRLSDSAEPSGANAPADGLFGVRFSTFIGLTTCSSSSSIRSENRRAGLEFKGQLRVTTLVSIRKKSIAIISQTIES